MTELKTLFPTLAALSGYAPGVDTSASLDDLQAASGTACRRIKGILTEQVFNIVIKTDDDNALRALRTAVANMTLKTQLVFDAVNRRRNDVDVYKYELEAMKRAYTENYYAAMDTLIGLIQQAPEGTELAQAWKASRYQQLMDGCQIRSADDFDVVYPIDGSQLFFFRTLPIQREILDARLGAYFDKVPDADRAASMLRLALCKKVVATAVRRFDVLECPATIRNLFDDQVTNGQRKDEREQAQQLADLLDQEADALISDIDVLLSAADGLDVSSMSAYNREDDNIVMMP